MSEQLRQISGFEILTKLSSGGMGDVLLARKKSSHGFEKLMAIKTIRTELAKRADIRAMFLDEARLVARLDHPAITQVYDFGEEDGVLYLAMEYVAGVALNKLLIKRGSHLPALVASRIAGEVARGLHAAHELTDIKGKALGVVHRDVSPGNVILTFDGHVKVLDFGIAFMNERESPDTQTGDLKGKPSYMAPEQLRGERVDRRSDIYSLSVVWHEMLTGRKLFSKNNVVATALAVQRGDVPQPSQIVDNIPDGLDGVVMRGLERDMEERYIDAKIMAMAIDDVLNQENARPLVDFVDEELRDEKDAHRSWLESVLSGDYDTSGTYETFPPHRIDRTGGVAPVADAGQPSAADQDEHLEAALASPTTLVPVSTIEAPAFTPDLGHRRLNPAWVAVLVFLAMIGLFVASRMVADTPKSSPIPAESGNLVELDPPPAAVVTPPPVVPDAKETTEPPAEPKVPVPAKATEKTAKTPVTTPTPKRVRPAVPKVPRHEAPTTYGFITVGAQPYARVRINGREVGATPIMGKKMKTGRYEIELISPATGKVRLKRTLVLREKQHARITAR